MLRVFAQFICWVITESQSPHVGISSLEIQGKHCWIRCRAAREYAGQNVEVPRRCFLIIPVVGGPFFWMILTIFSHSLYVNCAEAIDQTLVIICCHAIARVTYWKKLTRLKILHLGLVTCPVTQHIGKFATLARLPAITCSPYSLVGDKSQVGWNYATCCISIALL
jgi:hypothetical protein